MGAVDRGGAASEGIEESVGQGELVRGVGLGDHGVGRFIGQADEAGLGSGGGASRRR